MLLVARTCTEQKSHTVNASVAVLVSLANHLIDLIISQLLADRGHDVTQLSSRDEAIVVTVEDLDCLVSAWLLFFPLGYLVRIGVKPNLEGLADLLLRVGVLHLAGHHSQEFCSRVSCQYKAAAVDLLHLCRSWGFDIPGKSMVPLLSASTSLIISCSSDSDGFWPSERMTVPSSLVVICPRQLS